MNLLSPCDVCHADVHLTLNLLKLNEIIFGDLSLILIIGLVLIWGWDHKIRQVISTAIDLVSLAVEQVKVTRQFDIKDWFVDCGV